MNFFMKAYLNYKNQRCLYVVLKILYKHTTVFFNNLMIVLGGRTDEDLKSISIEVYDTETSEWFELTSFNKFRHSSWIIDNLLFSHQYMKQNVNYTNLSDSGHNKRITDDNDSVFLFVF